MLRSLQDLHRHHSTEEDRDFLRVIWREQGAERRAETAVFSLDFVLRTGSLGGVKGESCHIDTVHNGGREIETG